MYILDPKLQDNKIKNCKLVEDNLLTWQAKYEDHDGVLWVVYYPHSGHHGGGPRFMRMEGIPSDIPSFIDKALSSGNEADIIGCATDLSIGDYKLEEIVAAIKALREKHETNKIYKFIENFKPQDNRNNIGKHYSEIEKEYKARVKLLDELNSIKENC